MICKIIEQVFVCLWVCVFMCLSSCLKINQCHWPTSEEPCIRNMLLDHFSAANVICGEATWSPLIKTAFGHLNPLVIVITLAHKSWWLAFSNL